MSSLATIGLQADTGLQVWLAPDDPPGPCARTHGRIGGTLAPAVCADLAIEGAIGHCFYAKACLVLS
jgi:hypothetical protein